MCDLSGAVVSPSQRDTFGLEHHHIIWQQLTKHVVGNWVSIRFRHERVPTPITLLPLPHHTSLGRRSG